MPYRARFIATKNDEEAAQFQLLARYTAFKAYDIT